MSEDILQIDYDQMSTIGDQFQSQADVVEQMSRMLNTHFADLKSGGWEGAAADAFFTEYETELEPALKRLSSGLEDGGTLSHQIIQLLSAAEEEAAAQISFDADAAEGGFWNGFKDFFHGMYLEGKDMVTGLWTMVRHPIQTAKGLWHGITHPKQLWEAIKKPYVDDWNNGHPWRAIGRGTMAIFTTVLGTKGADKAAKALKGATVVDDVARVGTVVDDAGRVGGVADDVGRAGSTADDAGKAGSIGDDAARAAGNPTFQSSGTGNNLTRTTTTGGHDFKIKSGHAYREHRSGPATHPKLAGTIDEVESAIIDDVLVRIDNGESLAPPIRKIADPLGPSVNINGIDVRYNVIQKPNGTIEISDYIILP